MPEAPISESTPTPPPTPKERNAPSWLATLGVFWALIAANVAFVIAWEYHCGLTWCYPPSLPFVICVLIINTVFLLGWATALHGGLLKTVALVPAVILSVDPCLFYIVRNYDPFSHGLAEALRRTDLTPLRQWAAAHRPPKGEFATGSGIPGNETGKYATGVSVEKSSIPEEVWRTIPFRGSRPYVQFFRMSAEADWMLIVDHSGGFVSHNGFILNLGKDIDPKLTRGSHSTLQAAPHVWVFAG